jgi:hypothetical protein
MSESTTWSKVEIETLRGALSRRVNASSPQARSLLGFMEVIIDLPQEHRAALLTRLQRIYVAIEDCTVAPLPPKLDARWAALKVAVGEAAEKYL